MGLKGNTYINPDKSQWPQLPLHDVQNKIAEIFQKWGFIVRMRQRKYDGVQQERATNL